jgi:hypothetical protein
VAIVQTRIFVRADEAQPNWAETLIGRVIRPLTDEFKNQIVWFWFSRYATGPQDLDPWDFDPIPVEYAGGLYRSLRFRLNIQDDFLKEFKRTAEQLIARYQYWISGFREYPAVEDTGRDRFLGIENRIPGRAEQRSLLINNLYFAISQLVIDAVVGPDEQDRYRLEQNDAPENPHGSTSQSILHLFCNITNVPTEVKVFVKDGDVSCATFREPATPLGGWDQVKPFRLTF